MTNGKSIDTRASLLSRLKNLDDQDSWRLFYEKYWRLIYGQALKAGLTHVEAQEVVQQTLIALSRKIASFNYNSQTGSFKGWLFRLTQWRITDQFQKRAHNVVPLECVGLENDLPELDPSEAMLVEPLDSTWVQDWKAAMLEVAIDKLRKKLPPKHFQIFDLAVRKEQPTGMVAQTLGLNRGHVYLVKLRTISQLKTEIARLEKTLI